MLCVRIHFTHYCLFCHDRETTFQITHMILYHIEPTLVGVIVLLHSKGSLKNWDYNNNGRIFYYYRHIEQYTSLLYQGAITLKPFPYSTNIKPTVLPFLYC